MKPRRKLFVIRKYVMATDVNQAIRNDVWLDEDWKKANADQPTGNMGYKANAKR